VLQGALRFLRSLKLLPTVPALALFKQNGPARVITLALAGVTVNRYFAGSEIRVGSANVCRTVG